MREQLNRSAWLDTVRQDLLYAIRVLIQSPGFTLVAVLTLALGIGANTAIFSVVYGVLFQPLPYQDPQRLVFVWNRLANVDNSRDFVSPSDFADYKDGATLLEGIAATSYLVDTTILGDGRPDKIQIVYVSPDLFPLLGVGPAIGQGFTREVVETYESSSSGPDARRLRPVILSHELWRSRFSADPGVVGRIEQIDGHDMIVLGVMPQGFRLLTPADAGMQAEVDAWPLLSFNFRNPRWRDERWFRVIGRLEPGVTPAQAQADLEGIAARLRREFPSHQSAGIHVQVEPMHNDVVSHVRATLLALFGSVGFVLLVACANVASLLLARASSRGREMAIRSALGAGRGRILRQMMTESLLLSLLGGVAGLLLARLGIELLTGLRPANLPRVEEIGLSGTVLAFTLVASCLAALLFGTVPAMLSARTGLGEFLKERSTTAAVGRVRLQSLLVMGEMALSLVLLVGAGLMVRSFMLLQEVRPGFDSEGVLTINLPLPGAIERERWGTFYPQLEQRLAALPGVQAVGAVWPLPLTGISATGPYGLEGESAERWDSNQANYRSVTPGYFQAMGIRLQTGRLMTHADNDARRAAVVIDELMARRLWPGRTPVGERLQVEVEGERVSAEVVGVVNHVRHDDLSADDRETIYFNYATLPTNYAWFAVRGAGGRQALVESIQREVQAVDPDLPVSEIRLMEEHVAEAMAPTHFLLVLMTVFSSVALLLAAVGLYGVLEYMVRQRAREIGVRMAFGARQGNILGLVMGNGLTVAFAGLVIGLLGSFALTRFLASQLFEVTPNDPLTLAGSFLLLLIVAALACCIPALRAMRVDPMITIRGE